MFWGQNCGDCESSEREWVMIRSGLCVHGDGTYMKKSVILLWLLIVGITMCGPAASYAEEAGPPQKEAAGFLDLSEPKHEPYETRFPLLRLVSALAVVLVLFFLVVPFLKRLTSFQGAVTGTCPMQVLGQASLGRGKSVCVVQIAEKILVLGVGYSDITLLKELDQDFLQSCRVQPPLAGAGQGWPGFSQILRKWMKGHEKCD